MKRRSVITLLALAAAMCLCGCLNFPFGDPQTSRLDPDLQGYWLNEDDSSASLVVLYPYDQHTYLMETYDYTKDGGERKFQSHGVYKAWLTGVKGGTFLTLDALTQHLAPPDADRAYPLLRVSGNGNTRTVRQIDTDFTAFANAKNAADVSAILARELDNPKLYTDKTTQYHKLEPHGDEAVIKSMMGANQ